jgi:enoyl-CoA hydratase/carnithine racemase
LALDSLPASLEAELRGEVLVLRLARAAKRNALNDATIDGLRDLFARLCEPVKAVVLAGDGEHFSAGLDLAEMTELDLAGGIAHSRRWHQAFEQIQFGPVPVVAVLKGAVVGGGLELAAAAHVRVAERSAFYALPEGQRGIFVGGGGAMRLPRLIGTSRMMDMMLTGRVYDAEEGAAIGLSHYLVEEGAGLEKALALAGRIAGNAPLTNYAVLQVLPRIAESDQASGLMTEALMAAIAQSDPAAKQRLKDFLEKRAAKVGEIKD